MKFILLAILALSVTASHQIAINATNQEEVKTLAYNSYYNAPPESYAYEPQTRPAYNHNQMPYYGELNRPYYQEPYRPQTIIYQKPIPTPEPPKPPTEFDLTCVSEYFDPELSFDLSNTSYTFNNVYELIFANTGCILLSSSELTRFYIPQTSSIGSLVLHFRCTPNDKNLFNIASQSLKMSKRQRCNNMLCDLTGVSCEFYDVTEIRRLIINQAIGCENTQLTITCPVNTKIEIILANYGRTDSTICTQNTEALIVSGIPYVFNNINCILGVTSIVDGICGIDSNSCTIDVTNAVFNNDPCVDTYKYLRVEYACVYSRTV